MNLPAIPSQAQVVIIGGGVIGSSVAYHLAHLGWTDVVLLERSRLTSGTTWHAAGLVVTFGSLSATSTWMRTYTRDLYARLETETGVATGFLPVGFIEIASDRDRLEEYRRIAAFNRHCGIDVHELSAQQVADRFPLARTDDIHAGFYVAEDGRANPVDVTMSLARGARNLGVTMLEQVAVTGVTQHRGMVTGVTTTQGEIRAEYVVNCAGIWARQLGAQSGVSIPLQAAEHYYLVTEPIPGLGPQTPVLEDPASFGYYREEVGGLMVGLFEPVCAPWKVEGVPSDFSFGELEPDWDRMMPYVQKAMQRVPISLDSGIKKFFCGPESFTPDLAPIIGEAPELRHYFVAAGLNSIGILTGGGIGHVLAHWIVHGRPEVDITGINIDRLHPFQSTAEYRRTRTVESLGMVYQCHYPLRTMQTARGAKRSVLHDRLASRGACFREVSGWESPDWFAEPGTEPVVGPLGWGRPPWFDRWGAEHHAARTNVIMMDLSLMAKFLVQGRDAGAVLDRLSTNRVNEAPHRITYTQWLNEGGTIEADVTVLKHTDDRFWVVASDTAHRHVAAWLHTHIPDHAHAHGSDITGRYTQLNIQGPRSRDLLQSITDADLSNEALPFRGIQTIDIGFAQALCVRITYVGELGYELYIPTEHALHVYERLIDTQTRFGLRLAGLRALSSLRMEKGYRDYGHDIDNTDRPPEAGLGFALALDKPGGFIGRDAMLCHRLTGPLKRRMVQILLTDPNPLLAHGEIVYRQGIAVGYIRSASYGFTLGGAIGLAMVQAPGAIDTAWVERASWEVDVAGHRWPARASLRPMYDPQGQRIKA